MLNRNKRLLYNPINIITMSAPAYILKLKNDVKNKQKYKRKKMTRQQTSLRKRTWQPKARRLKSYSHRWSQGWEKQTSEIFFMVSKPGWCIMAFRVPIAKPYLLYTVHISPVRSARIHRLYTLSTPQSYRCTMWPTWPPFPLPICGVVTLDTSSNSIVISSLLL